MHAARKAALLPTAPAALVAGLALAAVPAPASAQSIPPAPVSAAKPAELNGIRQAALPNGLTVLTKEEHAAPVVYFSVWYRVGSVNEQVGQTGMSHLMEHMMFKGTKTRGVGVIPATLQNIGAAWNATTSFDRTDYFETVAPDRLETAVQIEADRMENSLYDEAQHQKEMTVVRSEYEAGENNPGVALDKAVRAAAYQIHPYRWDTIGYRADIENFTRDEMYAYYKNYYTPNNATVVIVGDFDTAKALAMVARYFGGYKPHPIQQHFITPEPRQEGERRVVVRRAGTLPQVEVVYHNPAFGDPDRYALDVLATVLSRGRTGRLFQDLVQTGLASSAGAFDGNLRDPDLFELDATAQPGHANAELEKALEAEVVRLQEQPVSPEELARALHQAEAGYAFRQESVSGDGATLGENAMKGDWRYGETYVANLRRVTAADVQRVAGKYLTQTNRTVGYFEPLRPPGARRPAAPPAPAALPPAAPASTEAASAAPAPASASPAQAGGAAAARTAPTRVVLDNGLTVIVQENHAHPTVSVSGAVLTAGADSDPADRRGLAALTASQLSRGTQTRSLLDIARTLEDVGAQAGVSGGGEYAALSGHALSRDLATVLDVLSDEMIRPAFPEAEFEKARAQDLAGVEFARQQTGALAAIALSDAIFPPGHPYHRPTLDEQAAFLNGVTRADAAAFHAARYAPDHTLITVVGDVNTEAAVAAVKRYFGAWPRRGLSAPAIPDAPAPSGPARTVVIPVPDKAQVDVLYGYAGGLRRSDPDFYAVDVLNTLLGAGFSSRLMANVRDRLGLVYGIYSSTAATLGPGPFEVRLGSNPANVDAAVAEMDRQLALLRDRGVTKDEVANAISYQTGIYAVAVATNSGVADQLRNAEIYGQGLDYLQKRAALYRAVTVDQVNAAARKYLHPGMGTLVIAGTYTGKYAAAR